MTLVNRRWIRVMVFLALTVMAACGRGDDDGATSAQPEDLPQIRHYLGLAASPGSSPWFIGVEKGFFEDAGVEVEILPGEVPSAGPGLLAGGEAETISADFTNLAVAKAENPDLPARLIAIHHQHSIHAIYSLKDGANIAAPEDLEGVTVHERLGSTAGSIMKVWAQENGYPVPKFEQTDPDAIDRLLISGEVPAVTSAVLSRGQLTAAAAAEGKELVTLELADHGLENFYGTGVAVSTTLVEEDPEAVQAFVDGMRATFEWCFANKEEAGAIFNELYPTFPAESVVASLGTLESLATDDGKLPIEEFGSIVPEKVEATVALIEAGLDVEIDVENLYTTEFID